MFILKVRRRTDTRVPLKLYLNTFEFYNCFESNVNNMDMNKYYFNSARFLFIKT